MTFPLQIKALLRSLVGVVVVAALVAAAMISGVLQPVEDAFSGLKFDLTSRAPSKEIVVVEIDVPSLRAAGRWPWERERYAAVIDNLHAAGASVVGFDVDFSARSSEAGDQAMAKAIHGMAGGVVLPTFVQPLARGSGAQLVENAPLGVLSAEAVLASVNVPVDEDGRVRRYHSGFKAGDQYRQSMAASLAGAPGGGDGSFLIDYGVDAGAIPHLSFEAVRRNDFDRSLVKGRVVLIGATALELGDEFATAQGVIPGVFVHALAFESLRAGRALLEPRTPLVFGLALLLILFLRPTRVGATTASLARRHVACLVLVPGALVAVQVFAPVSIAGAPLALAQALCAGWAVRTELRRRAEAVVQAREAGLLHLALHEPETELPNRRALLQQLAAEMDPAAERHLAVVVIGLDRYALMRSAIGYEVCNELVREVARRLSASLDDAAIAYLSTSVLGCIVRADDRASLLRKLERLENLEPSHHVGGHAIDVFMRAGVALLEPVHEGGAERLVEFATIALDEARTGNRRLVIFDRSGFADPSLNLDLMSEMRRGLEAGQLQLHYQPKVRTGDGRVEGAEALIRWRHPERGFIPPDSFIGAAEETGGIRRLTEWTILRALEDSARLRQAGYGVKISVNLSGRLLADPGFCEQLLGWVGERAHELCLEITETAVIDSPTEATEAIAAFHRAGLKVSIDDYGVGLSSLSYLKMLDADELKIDKSLVTGVVDSQRDRLIFKSTVDLAHSLGMTVVAEGIETAEVQAVSAALGCDSIQGYFYSKPLPLDQLMDFLETFPGNAAAEGGALQGAAHQAA